MKCKRIKAPNYWDASRGPDLIRWLTDEDLRFPEISKSYAAPKGSIRGALCDDYWVLFYGLQVIQVVPDEVHSAWHYEYIEGDEEGCAWKIFDSKWITTFHQRHLEENSHYVVRFYDDVVEVICKDILFGPTPFDLATAIELHPKFSDPYLQVASSNQYDGDMNLAIKSFEKYLSLSPDPQNIDHVNRCLEQLRTSRK